MESGVRESRVWKRLLGVEATVVEGVDLDPVSDAVVVSVRPDRRFRLPVRAVPEAVAGL